MSAEYRQDNSGKEVTGLVIIIIGFGLLLNTMNIMPFAGIISRYGLSLLFFAIGLLHISRIRGSEGWAGAAFWIILGLVFFVGRLPNFPLNPWRLFGPALIIWIGITILLKASRGPNSSQRPRRRERHVEMNFERSTNQPGRSSTVDSRDTVSATAILGGFDRKATSQEFRGGDLTTILGGGKVDLRDCNLHPDGAFLDVFTLMGGIEIFVPPDWVVESRVTPVLGSFEDTTHPPKESTKRITLDGTAIMGGVSIKN